MQRSLRKTCYLKKRPDLRGEKMTGIFKEIRSAVISAESAASFPVTRILRILGIARAWYYRHLDSDSKEDKRFNPYAVRDAEWIHWIQEGTSKAWVP